MIGRLSNHKPVRLLPVALARSTALTDHSSLGFRPLTTRDRRTMTSAGEEEQDGLSGHSAGHAPPSSASSLPKEQSQVELEIKILEALEHYPPSRLQGTHRHFVLYGMMEYLRMSFDRNFSAEEVLQLLDRFFNLELLKPDDDELEILNQEEEFSLPRSFFIKDE